MFLYNAFKYAFNIEKVKLYYHEKNQDIQAISKFNSRKQTILRNMDYYHRKIRELEKLMFCCDIDKNPNETNNLALK